MRARRLVLTLVMTAIVALATPNGALAQRDANYRRGGDYGLLLAGIATGFVSHEGGHLLLDGFLRAHPRIRGVRLGPLPFFAIEPQIVESDRELYAISMMGFFMQNAYAEAILQRNPHLIDNHRPFLEGMMLFHVALSLSYAITGFANAGPAQSDVNSMARAARIPPWSVGLMVLLPALFDTVRYFASTDRKWAEWTGISTRLPLFGMAFAF